MPAAAPTTPLDPAHADRFTVDTAYAKECLATPPAEALQEDFIRYAPDLAWWLERQADAKREVALVALDVEEQLGNADGAVRDELARGGGKVTEDAVKAGVKKHAPLLAAKKLLIDAEHFEGRVRAVVDALKAKRDMLVGLGATFRAEMQSDPSIRE